MTGRHEDLDGDGVADFAQRESMLLTPRGATAGLTADTLRAAMGASLPLSRYTALLPAFSSALIQAGCVTVNRAAMFAAQIGHESVGLKYGEEIASGAAYEGRKDLGNTHPGDGRRFKGHGWIQITGRANHTAVSKWAYSKGYVPSPTYFVDNPTALAADKYVWIGPVWYWTQARPRLNALSDAGDIVGATRAINGGTNGLSDRKARWNTCLRLGDALLAGHMPAPAPTRKAIPDMIERGFGPGSTNMRINCPTGSASALVARSWLSASIDGGGTVEVWAQKANAGKDAPTGAGADADAHRLWTLRGGDRPWFELPSGSEFCTVHVTGATGPGSVLIEQKAA